MIRMTALRFRRIARNGKKIFAGAGLSDDRGNIAQARTKPANPATAATTNAVRHPQSMPARPSRKERAVPTVKRARVKRGYARPPRPLDAIGQRAQAGHIHPGEAETGERAEGKGRSEGIA